MELYDLELVTHAAYSQSSVPSDYYQFVSTRHALFEQYENVKNDTTNFFDANKYEYAICHKLNYR